PVNDDARLLFQKMERRLAGARALECVFEIKAEVQGPGDPPTTLLLDGSLVLASGNRARKEMMELVADDGPTLFRSVVCDGQRGRGQDKGSRPEPTEEEPPKTLGADFRTLLARSGLYLPTLPLPPVGAASIKDRFPVSQFRIGPKEKVGDREAQRLEYQLE